MNKEKMMEIAAGIRKPPVLLSLIAISGLLVNALLYFLIVAPKSSDNFAVAAREQQLEAQIKLLQNKPFPAQISDKDIESLVKQVPVNEEYPRLVKALQDIERKSGATIKSLTLNRDKQTQDALTTLLMNASKQTNETQNVQTPDHTEKNGILEQKVTMTIAGTYAQATDFLNQMYQMERLVNVTQWGLHPVDSKVELNLTFVVYSAKAFAGKFQSLPSLRVEAEPKRNDPMMSDEQFNQMLQSQQQLNDVK